MKFNIIGRKIEVTEKMTEYIEKKLGRLDKFFKEEPEARIVLGTVKEQEYVETALYASGMIYRAEIIDSDVCTAVDRTVDVIERQIRRNKTRLEKKIKRDALASNKMIDGGEFDEAADTEEFKIIKRKRFHVKPMSSEEAVLPMNLLDHTFFVFKNRDTDEMNVVYKRKDGNYAIIESIE